MAEPTTPQEPASGAEEPAQPNEPAQQAAASQPEPANEPQPQEPSVDDNSQWLASKGIDPETLSTPEGQAALIKNAREAEKLMSKATQQASQLDKTMQPPANPNPDDGMQEFVSEYRRDKMLNQFKSNTPDWQEHESTMVDLLAEVMPSGYTRSQLVNAGVLNLTDVYAMAKGTASKQEDTTQVLQTIKNKQMAGGLSPNASSGTPEPKKYNTIDIWS